MEAEREPSGETWSGKSTSNQDLVLSCFGNLEVKGLHGHRSVHQLEGEHHTGHRVTRRKLTQKTDADTNAKTRSGRRSIVSSWLSSKFVRKENVSVLSQSPRGLFVNVTLVKSSATVSPVDATFSLKERKTSGCKLQNNNWSFVGKGILN